MTRNILKFKVFSEFPEVDCQFYGKGEEMDEVQKNKIVKLEQVHGNRIIQINEDSDLQKIEKADGLITNLKNIYISVHVADCVPVLFFAPDIKMIGVCHSGWKGTLLNIAGIVVNKLKEKRADVKKIKCAIGPAICGNCYKVNVERVEKFRKMFPDLDFQTDSLDLKYIVRRELEMGGVDPKNIDTSNFCTKCDHNRFYSHRQGDRNTPNVGIIGLM
jgi:polyphenol oxidase